MQLGVTLQVVKSVKSLPAFTAFQWNPF